jgi:hypothetical protein
MRGSTLVFHGDVEDLRSLFVDWFGDGSLTVIENMGRLNAELERGNDPDFIMSRLLKPGDISAAPMAIAPTGRPIALRTVVMADGSGKKLALDFTNRFMVGIEFGGQTGPSVLQPTILKTSGDDDEARALFQRLKKTVTKRATRVRDCWVLPGAYEKLRQGWRLPGGQFHAAITDLPKPDSAS